MEKLNEFVAAQFENGRLENTAITLAIFGLNMIGLLGVLIFKTFSSFK